MKRQPARRSGLFLMELIVAILFFSLASAVCVKLFVKSHTLEKDSVNLTHAVNAASSAAEIFRGSDDFYGCLKEQFPDGESAPDAYRFFYNKNWNLCKGSESVFTVTISTKTADGFLIGEITVVDDTDTLYELSIKKYDTGRET